jgi:hypothetical protein
MNDNLYPNNGNSGRDFSYLLKLVKDLQAQIISLRREFEGLGLEITTDKLTANG